VIILLCKDASLVEEDNSTTKEESEETSEADVAAEMTTSDVLPEG